MPLQYCPPRAPKERKCGYVVEEAIDSFRIYKSSQPETHETKYAVGKTVYKLKTAVDSISVDVRLLYLNLKPANWTCQMVFKNSTMICLPLSH